MSSYSVFLIAVHGSKADATPEIIECDNDAQALGEACKFFGRDSNVDTIQVWDSDRQVAELGARPPSPCWRDRAG
jgi:hypothetical protein